MQLKKTVAAIVLGLGFTAFAQAANVYDFGVLHSDETLSRKNVPLGTAGVPYNHFDEQYTFTIEPGLQNASLGIFSIDMDFTPFGGPLVGVTSLWINIYTDAVNGDVGNVLQVMGQPVVVDSFGTMSYKFEGAIDFTQFSTTNYVIRITGETAASGLGAYSVSLTGGPAAVVPEPSEYAMLLAGLGVVGMIARRRKVMVN